MAWSCTPKRLEMPSELLGRWTTTASGFDGRALTFTLDSVTIATGEEPPSRHPIVAVEAGPPDAGAQAIVLVYEGEGGNEYRLGLLYETQSGQLRLVNRSDVVWMMGER